MTDAPKTEDSMVAALLREREGLAQRGLTDRVGEVDEQLKLRGYTPDGERTAEDAPETPEAPGDAESEKRSAAPKGRRPRNTETA
jgi:hypothetical protein